MTISPCFTYTVRLRTTPRDRKVLAIRMEAARSLYNALLRECLRRLKLMRESRGWRKASVMPNGKEKAHAHRSLEKTFRFSAFGLYDFIKEQRKSHIGIHVDSHTAKSLAERAFAAVSRWLFSGFGMPRFRKSGELNCVEGDRERSPISWNDGFVRWSGKKGNLVIHADINRDNPFFRHANTCRICFVRIIRRNIKGKDHYCAQLVLEGHPYKKPRHHAKDGVVGLDIGPSTVAIVSRESARLETFCDELKKSHQQIRRLQRKFDRQILANNPECFDDKGRWVKGAKATNRTSRMKSVRTDISEVSRREAEHRKNLHGRLSHEILAMGNDIRMEALSYKSWQQNKRFAKSIQFRAPGTFVAKLKSDAKKFGATVTEFPTRTTALSQTCPNCGAKKKKQLSERWHSCPCGCEGQRDLISALSATCVVDGKLDLRQSREAWRGSCNILQTASGLTKDSTFWASARKPLQPNAGRESSLENAVTTRDSDSDVVADRKVQARAG